MEDFAKRVIDWQRTHGRHDLPWQGTNDPYRIWLSEVMLQQTQVATVIPYYLRFLQALPDVATLARAPLERVLELWSGLGYYSRARNLHAAARRVLDEHAGRFPSSSSMLEALPGVGRSTAAAIAVFSAGERAPILDGNVKRVFCRHDAIDTHPAQAATLAALWRSAHARLPERDVQAYTQGLMDLGATLCTRTRPNCAACPLTASCQGRALGRPTAFPVARVRRTPPVRAHVPLVILDADRVLLERRPDKGVWGGLWSLPACDQPDPDQMAIRTHVLGLLARIADGPHLPGDSAPPKLDLPVPPESQHRAAEPPAPRESPPPTRIDITELSTFNHALTHFVLRITPWRVVLESSIGPIAASADDRYRWLSLEACEAAALARPIKRLLLGLASG